jgi:hypothetical protein
LHKGICKELGLRIDLGVQVLGFKHPGLIVHICRYNGAGHIVSRNGINRVLGIEQTATVVVAIKNTHQKEVQGFLPKK